MNDDLSGLDAGHPLSYATIEKMAALVRESLGIPPDDPIPGIQLFESLDAVSVRVGNQSITLDYDCQELPENVLALARYDSDRGRIVVVLSPQTYEDLEHDQPRARFSFCHELGHALVHPELLMKLSQLPPGTAATLRRGEPKHPKYRDTEWQANAFASALLMPAAGLDRIKSKGMLRSFEIQTTFGVSATAARIREEIFNQRRRDLLR